MNQVFLCKVEGRLGPEPNDLKQARILNRVVTWEDWGIRYEADPRQIENLMGDLKVDDGVKIAALINGTSDPLLEWIRFRAPDNDWRAIRNQVVGYARTMGFGSTTASTSSSMPGPAPMEIDAVWKGGKSKGKGKGKGKGKRINAVEGQASADQDWSQEWSTQEWSAEGSSHWEALD